MKPFVGLVDHERLTLPRSDLLTELVNVLTAVPVRNRLVPETVNVILADELREYVELGDTDVDKDCREEIVCAPAAGSIMAKTNTTIRHAVFNIARAKSPNKNFTEMRE
jgi:hypothetical protein